ncbi:MAG: hypothetical protein HXK96_00165 [Candidatus Nanogingivalaceae bacterium]|nr:hypothetical protein [Candidatus Nanogingivalaceae bacterium]
MNNFWVGFKNKKGIFLAILALVSFNTFFISDGDYAYAAGKNYTYTASDCKKAGLEFDKPGIGTRAGTGCVFYSTSGAIFGNKDIDATVLGSSNDLSSKMDAYTTNDSGKEPSTCLSGYKKGRYDFGQAKDVPACVKDKSHKGSSGLPSGVKESDIYDEKSCTADGGSWFFSENDHHRGTMCGFGKTLRDDGATDDWNYAMTKKQIPKEFFASSESCPKGYVKFLKTQNGKQRNACKKSSKGSDLDCTKEENKEKQECKDVEKDSSEDGDGDGSDDKNSCAIEWVGWIMCPVIRGANSMVVSTYSLMQQHFLNIKADEIFQQDKPAFKTWSSFRDIANVFFVIILSIIIFSQVSGVGISNYGIKKMLPKIIVFAILVNISWYVSVIMIDISNIVGHSLYEWLSGDGTWQYSSDSQQDTSPVEGILSGAAIGVGTAAAVSGTLAGSTSILMFIFSAALALIMMVFILLIRQAAVIVLVVVSPVAFVAGILPNTEGVFKKWIKFFKNMLMIYPICSLIVGGSIFVSNLLYNNESSPLLKIAYGLLPILSLFTIVAIIKSVLSIIDGLTGGNLRGTLDKMSGKLTNATANSRPLKRAEEFQRNLKFKGVALGRDAREAKYQANKANRTYNRNRRELNKLLNKDNQTAADFRQITRLGGEIGAHEKAQSEGMVSAMTTAIGGNVGNVAGQLRMVASATDPDQQRLMYGALSQAVTNAGLGAAAQSSALGDIVDSGLNTSDSTQRQAIMSQIASKSGAEIKKVNPAAAKAAMQNVANKDNIKSVSDFEKEVSTYAGASAQQMAGWSAMSSSNTADNKALDAMEKAFASGDQTQIGHAQNMGKVADQALNANSKGTMFLTPDQQKNFQAMSNLAKKHDPANAVSTPTPTPAPVPAGSQNMQVGVNYSVNNNSQTSEYGAPAATQQAVVDQYKSNRRFGPQRSK